MIGIIVAALKSGLVGLLIGPLVAAILALAVMALDPRCGVGDLGGCAMGVVSAPIAVAVPSFLAFFAFGLFRQIWARRQGLLAALLAATRDMRRD